MAIIKGAALIKPEKKETIIPPMDEMFGPGGPGGPGGSNSPDGPGDSGGPGFEDNTDCRPAVCIVNGVYDAAQSVPDVIFGGEYDGKKSDNLKVVSYAGIIGGIHVRGANSIYTLSNATISLSGRGKGLAGRGTGASVEDHAMLTLKNCAIYTNGKARCCTSAENYSVLKVYDSVLISQGAPYGEGVPPLTGPAATPPAALEIEGNCRTHCTMGNSSSYFINSKIICDGWAALSTDGACGYVYLEADNCDIISTKSGYGVYADAGCHDVVKNCRLDVTCMGAIIGGEADVSFSDSIVKCGTYLALMHCVNGQDTEVGSCDVQNCKVTTEKEAFLIKSHNVQINLGSSDIVAKNGVLVRSMINDDPIATKVGPMPVYGVNVLLRDMNISGDMIHEDPDRDMWIRLEGTVLTGAIRDAVLSMDLGSKWIATGNSYITLFGNVETAQIDAPDGVTITAKGGEDKAYSLASGGWLVVSQ